MIEQSSSSDIPSTQDMFASALTGIFLYRASVIFEFKIASVMGFPVLVTVSTVFKSSSSISKYCIIAGISPFCAYTFMVCMWLR